MDRAVDLFHDCAGLARLVRFGRAGGLLVALLASLLAASLAIGSPETLQSPFVQRLLFHVIFFNVVALITSNLSERERRAVTSYYKMYDGVPVGLYRTTREGQLVNANPALVRLLGYPDLESLLAVNVRDLYVYPENRAQQFALHENKTEIRGFKMQLYRYDGSIIWVQDSVRAIYDAPKISYYYEGGLEDITAQMQAQEALRESEEKLRSIVENSNNLFYSHTPGHTLTYLSPQSKEFLQCEPEEAMISWTEFTTTNPVNEKGFALTVKAINTGQRQPPYQLELVGAKGRVIWVEVRESPIVKDGKTVAIVGSLTDITARKQTEVKIARLATVVEQATVTIVITDLTGNIVYANPHFEISSGYSVTEALGQNPHILKSDHQDMSFYRELWKTITAGHTWHGVFINQRKDGALYHEDATIFPIQDPGGEIINYAAVKLDISERVQAEQAQQESETRYRTLFEQASDAIFIENENDEILDVNQRACELLGYTRQELLTMSVTDIQAPEARGRTKRIIKDELEQYQGTPFESTDIHRDGTRIPVELNTSRLIGAESGLVLSIVRDVTARKQAEAERELLLAQIHEQAERIQQTINAVPEGVLLLDAGGHVVLTNPAGTKDLRVLVGQDDIPPHAPITHLGGRPLAELLTSPSTKGLWHEVKAGARTFKIIARPIANGANPENWALVINDVTQERAVREQLQRQERLAAVGQLAAGIAHDFNNIMAVVVLYAQMTMRDATLPTRVQERMATINQQAQHATKLIQQILDFSRRAVLERRPFDLLPLLKEQVRLLKRTLPENIQIQLNYGPDEHIIHADPTRMQQVVMNLAVNARDAMPEGGRLHIDLARITSKPSALPLLPEMAVGEWVRLTVSDTGTGIPADVRPHIFEPFFTTKEPGAGTGLGLAQIHGIVGVHKGHIAVKTQIGQGTTFSVYLPALPTHPIKSPELELLDMTQGRGETLLVVEDEITVRQALVESLASLNYRCLEAANGQAALAMLEQHTDVALVLSDLIMPEMGGQALFHALKQQGLPLPMVVLSGHPMKTELENLHAQGLAGWLLKPPRMEQLAQLLARVLQDEAERLNEDKARG